MKKLLTITALAIACVFTPTPRASAQSAIFTYSGVPTSSLAPGASFTIGVNLNFTQGGNIQSLGGLSYWMYQQSPTSGFPFSITNRDVSGSQFSERQSPFIVYPQVLTPINVNPPGSFGGLNQPATAEESTDLGALGNPSFTNSTGVYFIANLTFSIAGNAAPGSYTIASTSATTPNVGGRISVFNASNSSGTTAPITQSPFTVTVIPEPSTYALLVTVGLGAAAIMYRRRSVATQSV